VEPDKVKDKVRLEDLLKLVTMDDIVHHRYKNKNHRAYIPDFGVYTIDYDTEGNEKYHIVSRQMVIFCVERRKAWRMLQSRAGIENKDYVVQKELLHRIDTGEATAEEVLSEMAVK
jgi:pyruvate-ferredoxin/flavodoxin oxidoreductase